MSVLIRDGIFIEDQWTRNGGSFHDFDNFALRSHEFDGAKHGINLPSSVDPDTLTGFIGEVAAIRIYFPSFADGRGFSLAKRLRQLGFSSLLRAHGHMLADQYPLALRCGFDEIEISDELAARQGEEQWQDAFERIHNTYLDRLQNKADIELEVA